VELDLIVKAKTVTEQVVAVVLAAQALVLKMTNNKGCSRTVGQEWPKTY
jgi:hypothetical protein